MRSIFLLMLCTYSIVGLVAEAREPEVPLQPRPCSQYSSQDPNTLDWLLSSNNIESHVSYQLLPGEHCIRNFSLVRDLENITFMGPARINCTIGNGLAFYNVAKLSIIHLTIDGCGIEKMHLDYFLLVVNSSINYFFSLTSRNPDQLIAMVAGNCSDFLMEQTVISNTQGLGFLAINLIGRSRLDGVIMEQNFPTDCSEFSVHNYNLSTEKVGGGALIAFSDYLYSFTSASSLEIVDSHFMKNLYCGFSSLYSSYYHFDESVNTVARLLIGGGGGLTLQLTQLKYQVNITVTNSEFVNNTATYGSGVHVELFAGITDCHLFFLNCSFLSNGVESPLTLYPIHGSALSLLKDFIQPNFSASDIRSTLPNSFRMFNSTFENNSGYLGTVSVQSLYSYPPVQDNPDVIEFNNCIFEYNRALLGAAMYFQELKASSTVQPGIIVLLKHMEFRHNSIYTTFTLTIKNPSTVFGIIMTTNVNLTIAENSVIEHNSGTGLSVTSTFVTFRDRVTFCNNSASYGGGIYINGESFVIVGRNATLALINNTAAILGGAIFGSYESSFQTTASYNCIFYFGSVSPYCLGPIGSVRCEDVTELGAKIIFDGNQAPLGNMIYGSTLESCPWSKPFREKYAPGKANASLLEIFYEESNFTSPFKFDTNPDTSTSVSTSTVNITVEQPRVDDWNISIPISMAPGIVRELNITALDGFGRTIPTVITSRSSSAGTTSSIGGSNFKFLDYNTSGFTKLKVMGSPHQNDVEVLLYVVETYVQVPLKVDISECPDGYFLNNSTSGCTCIPTLELQKITCTDDGQLIVPLDGWIGRGPNGTLSIGGCPFDYCVDNITVINSSVYYDQQCDYHRSGIACGECAKGYSAIFGSNRCMKCSNTSLLLLILFAAYGIFLILVIIFLRLTISEGYLNGVLFFSNILSVYLPYFAPNRNVQLYFLVFSWLSLRLGFEACFFDGMTTLHATALHFIFPLYLYFLLVVIILLSRWSGRFARKLVRGGFSPTKLFVTILVMTYSSLLESCIEVLSFSPLILIESNNDSHRDVTVYRWSYDPSLGYFEGQHAPLAVFAILILISLILTPFIWMFPSVISRIRWVQKYKPLFDAVWAPLKPQFRFWVTLRLILRVPLLIINVAFPPLNYLLLGLFLLVLLFIQGLIQPFRGTAQNVFDRFFQMMLIVLVLISIFFSSQYLKGTNMISIDNLFVTSQYINELEYKQSALICTALAICYIAFILIVVWHLMLRFPKLKYFSIHAWNFILCKKCHLHSAEEKRLSTISNQESPGTYGAINDNKSNNGDKTEVDTAKEVATFSELREPLLEESTGVAEIYQVNKN